jgi:hypothetical protein
MAFEEGDRVSLTYTSDPHTDLKPGDEGTVRDIDGAGTIHINWDQGSTLGMILGEDRIRLIGKAPKPGAERKLPG